MHSVEDDRHIRDGDQGEGDCLHAKAAAEKRNERDGYVELLFDRDAPEGIDGIGGNPTVETNPPIAGKEGEGEPREWILGTGVGEEPLQQDQAVEDQEVQGPNAQDAAYIEGFDLDFTGFVAFAEEQLGDEEGAEQEENGDAEVAEKADVIEPIVLRLVNGNEVHPMDDENHQEGDETEHVEFRAIVAFDGHFGSGKPLFRFGRDSNGEVRKMLLLSFPTFCRNATAIKGRSSRHSYLLIKTHAGCWRKSSGRLVSWTERVLPVFLNLSSGVSECIFALTFTHRFRNQKRINQPVAISRTGEVFAPASASFSGSVASSHHAGFSDFCICNSPNRSSQ